MAVLRDFSDDGSVVVNDDKVTFSFVLEVETTVVSVEAPSSGWLDVGTVVKGAFGTDPVVLLALWSGTPQSILFSRSRPAGS